MTCWYFEGVWHFISTYTVCTHVHVYCCKSLLIDKVIISPTVCIAVHFNTIVFAASQAAAEARGRAGKQSAAVSSFTGMSLQEAQQILNISTLNPDEIQKVCHKVALCSLLEIMCSFINVTPMFYALHRIMNICLK